MNAIVPYGGLTVARRVAYSQAAQRAIRARRFQRVYSYARAGALMYRKSRAAYQIGRTLVRSYRKRKHKMAFRRSVGQSGATRAISHRTGTTLTTEVAKNTGTLYTEPLVIISRDSSTSELNERSRDVINLRGVKLCFELRNIDVQPIYVNMAIVKFKPNFAGQPSQSTAEALSTVADLFRSDGGNTRSVDFNRSTLTGLQMRCLPLNKDVMEIFMHQRLQLNGNSPDSPDFNRQYGSNYLTFEKWVPIKRRVTFRSETGTIPEDGNIHLIYWFTEFGATAGAPFNDVGRLSMRIVTYWHNINS